MANVFEKMRFKYIKREEHYPKPPVPVQHSPLDFISIVMSYRVPERKPSALESHTVMLKAMEFILSQFLQMAPIKQYNPDVYVHTCPPMQYHRHDRSRCWV
jgi:hypothetical protein